jgi:alcohol dehydrogenase (NADP+)
VISSQVPAAHQMEMHPYLQQSDFAAWHWKKGIHIIQFSPCGNLNSFYREVSWGKKISHMARLIDSPALATIAQAHGRYPIQVALAWAVNSGRSVIPKSTIEWQIKENLDVDFDLNVEEMKSIEQMDRKARFNDPSQDFGYKLYVGLDGAAP